MRAAYWLLFAGLTVAIYGLRPHAAAGEGAIGAILPEEARVLAPFLVVSLILINALAVTSLTTERDGRALDLLLVTDLTPQEFVFGKLGGVFFNAKEMIALPMLLCGLLWHQQRISGENLVFVLVGLLVMNLFVAMLGIHVGMIYANSRNAIGISLGTVLFLFIGVATCMRIMLAFSGSFQVQLTPFIACMVGGGAALFMALGHRNPSPAILLASFAAPFATLYVITSFIMGHALSVFLVTVITYGFATAAMLVPAIYEFDMATGRTSADRE
jgi:ABC-type Na+ efflux pump permease subunit